MACPRTTRRRARAADLSPAANPRNARHSRPSPNCRGPEPRSETPRLPPARVRARCGHEHARSRSWVRESCESTRAPLPPASNSDRSRRRRTPRAMSGVRCSCLVTLLVGSNVELLELIEGIDVPKGVGLVVECDLDGLECSVPGIDLPASALEKPCQMRQHRAANKREHRVGLIEGPRDG